MTASGADWVEIVFPSLALIVFAILLIAGLMTGRIAWGRGLLRIRYADRRTNPALFWVIVGVYLVVLLGISSMLIEQLDFSGWRLLP